MANPKPQPKRAKHGAELVQRGRAAVLNALDVLDRRGKLISELLADEIEKNPLKFMDLLSKLAPRERHVEHSGTIHQTVEHRAVSETDQRIEELIEAREDPDTAKTLPH